MSLTMVLLVITLMEVMSSPYTCRPATRHSPGHRNVWTRELTVLHTAATSTHTLCARCTAWGGRAGTSIPEPGIPELAHRLICTGQSLAGVGQTKGGGPGGAGRTESGSRPGRHPCQLCKSLHVALGAILISRRETLTGGSARCMRPGRGILSLSNSASRHQVHCRFPMYEKMLSYAGEHPRLASLPHRPCSGIFSGMRWRSVPKPSGVQSEETAGGAQLLQGPIKCSLTALKVSANGGRRLPV